MRHILFCIAFGAILSSCSPKLQYNFDAPLSEESFSARDRSFSGKIPLGWFTSEDTAVARSLEAWLIAEDFSAVIAFRELHLDEPGKHLVADEGLETLAKMSAAFVSMEPSPIKETLKEFKLGKKEFCSYEVMNGSVQKRVVVFNLANRYFECEASVNKGQMDAESLRNLFTVQQSLLASIQWSSTSP